MATFYKGTTPILNPAKIGGEAPVRVYQGGAALGNVPKVGDDVGYGYIYKVDDNGQAMVVSNEDYTGSLSSPYLFQWSNGFCSISPAESLTDGRQNMYNLWYNSTGGCLFQLGYDVYENLYITGSLWGGEGGWYIPAENELEEVYNSGVLFSGRYTSGDGGYYFSSTGDLGIGANPYGRMLSFNTGVWANSSESDPDARCRLIRRL